MDEQTNGTGGYGTKTLELQQTGWIYWLQHSGYINPPSGGSRSCWVEAEQNGVTPTDIAYGQTC